jgi:RNA polymerase sigma-70 factor (ECF subfamily)
VATRSASENLDDDIVAALKGGERDALALLYDRCGGIAFSLAMRILGDPGAAEEVVQDAFLTVWNRASAFDHNRGSFRAWLFTCVRNRAIDRRRGSWAKYRHAAELPLSLQAWGEGSDPLSEVSVGETRDAVRRALQELPTAQREAIELAYFGGLSRREISERLKTPPGTISSRMRLGLERLGQSLELRDLQAAQ